MNLDLRINELGENGFTVYDQSQPKTQKQTNGNDTNLLNVKAFIIRKHLKFTSLIATVILRSSEAGIIATLLLQLERLGGVQSGKWLTQGWPTVAKEKPETTFLNAAYTATSPVLRGNEG